MSYGFNRQNVLFDECFTELDFWKNVDAEPHLPLGQYALVRYATNRVYFARDPLGVNKAFYSVKDGYVLHSDRIAHLCNYGCTLDQIHAVQPGTILALTREDSGSWSSDVLYRHSVAVTHTHHAKEVALTVSTQVTQAIEHFLRQGGNGSYANPVPVVALSGGMDSTIVAHQLSLICNAKAITFCLLNDTDYEVWRTEGRIPPPSRLSADYQSASEICKILGIEFMPCFAPRSAVRRVAEKCVYLSQDWRDFNVHCAIVNYFISHTLASNFPGTNICLFTGDQMNEYFADYESVKLMEEHYYPQPRIRKGIYRRHLIAGLDSCDREGGVFSNFGIAFCQPYGACIDVLTGLPDDIVEAKDAKWKLLSSILPAEVKPLIQKNKVRAQVGGNTGGVLAACIDDNITPEHLKTWWCQFHKCDATRVRQHPFIRLGRYQS